MEADHHAARGHPPAGKLVTLPHSNKVGKPVDIVEIGTKPGEKMYEELMNDEEVRRTYEYSDFFVILSAFADATSPKYNHLTGCGKPNRPYSSLNESAMSRAEVEAYLSERGLL